MDINALRRTVLEVDAAIQATDRREFPRSQWGWPAGSCEDVSATLAAVLEERQLGEWTLVIAARPEGKPGGHAWPEQRDRAGTVMFSIDPTIEQFPGWSEAFIGDGQTPVASEFSDVQWEGRVWDWPDLGPLGSTLRRLIRTVQEQLA